MEYEQNLDNLPVVYIGLDDQVHEYESFVIYADGDAREEEGDGLTAEQARVVSQALQDARDIEPATDEQVKTFRQNRRV